MTKWIRWSGLIGFTVLIAILAIFWMFAAAPIIKFSIEKFGSDAVGAKIDVAEVNLGFNPLVLSISGVEVADKSAPMSNLVSFENAVADLSLFPLLLGKSIIQDMSLEGVEFGSIRKISGALEGNDEDINPEVVESSAANQTSVSNNKADSVQDKSSGPSSEAIPSADEILAREPLVTITRGEKFKLSLAEHKKELNESIALVPNTSAMKEYQNNLDLVMAGKLKSVEDFKARKKALDKIKVQFKIDQKAIKRAQAAIKSAKKDLGSQWPLLKKAPGEDYKNIKGKYTLDANGTSNLTALLFGDDAGGYAKTGLKYYEKLSPLLASDEEAELVQAQQDKRLTGSFIHFPTDRPLPDFWLKNLSFSAKLPLGEVAVVVKDITHQQDVINKATTLKADGRNMHNLKALTLNGVLDHRNGQGKDTFDLNIQQWQLQGLNLGLAGLELNQSNLNVQADVIFKGSDMNAHGQGQFSKAEFSSKDRTVLAKEMVAALTHIDTFVVSGKAQGELASPNLSIQSDLDNKLSRAFNKRLKQKQSELEKQLKQKLADKLLSYSGDYEDQLRELNATEGGLGDTSKAMGKMAKAEVSSYEDQLKADAKAKADKKKAKLKDKLENKFKKLF
ncbi:MAG: TIGR03545 family protein [Bermanella sp.]